MTCDYCGGIVGLDDDLGCSCIWCARCGELPVEIAGEELCSSCMDDVADLVDAATDPDQHRLEEWAEAMVEGIKDVHVTGDRL